MVELNNPTAGCLKKKQLLSMLIKKKSTNIHDAIIWKFQVKWVCFKKL